MSEPVPVWLDCDPGHDDTFAILLAAHHPGIRLLGISTVHGNASLDKTTQNALSILAALGRHRETRVFPGHARALHRPAVHAAPTDIHGESGLDGTDLLPRPATRADTSVTAVEAMARSLRRERPGTAWVVATGALTNVGALFRDHPDLAAHVAGLSAMGGSVGGGFTPAVMGKVDDKERVGNWTAWAEFNVLIDPEAAAALLGHPVLAPKITLVPLDLTHLVLATAEVQDLILYGPEGGGGGGGGGGGTGGDEVTTATAATDKKNKKGKSTLRTMLVELLNFFAETYRDVFGIVEGPPLHDPLAVAAVLTGTEWEIPFYDWDPKGAEGPSRRERFAVDVVTEGTLEDAFAGAQTGRTVVKLLDPPGTGGVRIPRGLDISMFWRVIEECCQRADETNEKLLAAS
ncbi:inosine-uridine preferring nucleoside hydrolase [Xylariomycetidae sp. FL2044]|nr:inosine-uridine preferring nucleoside hydrolase [Xylariomycetidae sp. FL2044]